MLKSFNNQKIVFIFVITKQVTTIKKTNIMDDLTKSLLKDLQDDLNYIKNLESNIEVVWALNMLKQNIIFTKNEIEKNK